MTAVLPVGLQLYTLRDALQQNYEGTLKRVAAMGYAGVEPFGLPERLDEIAALIRNLGLAVPSAHVPMPEGDNVGAMARIAQAYGMKRVVSGLGPDDFKTLDDVKRSCERINAAARVAAEHGLVFGYHNHWWEIEPVEGQRPYTIMLETLDPAVFFEIDVYWVQVGGVDPADMIRECGARAQLLHIKDGPADAPPSDMVPVGQGRVDIPAAVRAAEHAVWLIVELDRCATDIFAAVEASYRYMTARGLGHGRDA